MQEPNQALSDLAFTAGTERVDIESRQCLAQLTFWIILVTCGVTALQVVAAEGHCQFTAVGQHYNLQAREMRRACCNHLVAHTAVPQEMFASSKQHPGWFWAFLHLKHLDPELIVGLRVYV